MCSFLSSRPPLPISYHRMASIHSQPPRKRSLCKWSALPHFPLASPPTTWASAPVTHRDCCPPKAGWAPAHGHIHFTPHFPSPLLTPALLLIQPQDSLLKTALLAFEHCTFLISFSLHGHFPGLGLDPQPFYVFFLLVLCVCSLPSLHAS